MGEGAGDGARGDPRGGGPGALSRLLDELARAPRADPEAAWGKGLRPGDVLDRFEIIRELGRGGFGAVYEAVDRELGRRVALKTLRPGRSRDEWVDAQLRAEAQAAASLSHPGIVTLHEACICDRGPYLVMELLRGETLEARLARGPLPPGEAVEVGLQISRALAHVHSHGLVHRDMKPGNVFLGEDGRVKLLDLGLAHLLGRKSSTGGTPAYVAPEQWRGEAVDGRADVFALGAVLFEMASGRRTFEVTEGRSDALDPGPAPVLGGRLPRGLARLVARCLAKDPGARPTAARVAEELLTIQRGLARPRAARRLAFLVFTGVLAGIAIAIAALRGPLRAPGGGGPDERIAVAVADVANETGERELDVLSGLLVTSLEQSRRLSVMTQARVLDLAARAGRRDAARVDETLGREVGKAHGVRALLLPAVRRLGTTYSLEMRAIDPGRDEHLFTLSDRATSREGLLDLLDRLAERARRQLGEGASDVAGASIQLAEAMSRSLEAYQHYARGIDAWYRDRHGTAGLRELLDAVRLDPRFAAAHGELAPLYEAYGRPDLAAPHWRAAAEHRAHMPEKERLLLDLSRASSLHAPENRSPAEVRRLAAALEARFADDKFVLWAVGDAYLDADVRERARAERAWRRALELDPGDCRAADSLQWVLGDRPVDLIASARLAVTTRRSACNLTVLARAERAAGTPGRAAQIAREALNLDGVSNSFIVRAACDVLDGVAGRPACSTEWRRLLQTGANELERDFARFQLAASLAIEGRRREALRVLGPVPGEWRGDPTELTRLLAVGIPMPDAAESRAMARRIPNQLLRRYVLTIYGGADEADALSAGLPTSERFEFAERLYEPLRLAKQGRYGEAAEAQRRARDQALVDEGEKSAYWMACFLAELLLAAGRPEEAASVQVNHSQGRNLYLLGQAAHGLRLALVRARAMEQLGRRADALRELDGVVAFWKEADGDLPLLVEAKAMRRRLAGTPSSRSPR